MNVYITVYLTFRRKNNFYNLIISSCQSFRRDKHPSVLLAYALHDATET